MGVLEKFIDLRLILPVRPVRPLPCSWMWQTISNG